MLSTSKELGSRPIVVPVTVVIPAYNRAGLIARAIQSALNQSPRRPAEIIVVDDGSVDSTAESARVMGAKVIVHKVNRGGGEARNTGVLAASQPWVAFLDSDDEWLPTHLSRLWPRRDSHVLVASSAIARGGGAPDRLVGHSSSLPVTISSPRDLIIPSNPIPASGVLARRDVVLEVGGFKALTRSEDLDLWIRMLSCGTALACPEPGYTYHQHDGQVTTDRRQMRAALLDLVESYRGARWWDEALLRQVEAQMRWDEARASVRGGERRAPIRKFAALLSSRAESRAVLKMLTARRRLRHRGKAWVA